MGRKVIRVGNCENGCLKSIHARGVCRRCYSKIHYEEHGRQAQGKTKMDIHPLGTISIDATGYARIKVRNDKKGKLDWDKHHRYVMEQLLGRKLFPFENVHHKNGVKSDNREENLELWITKQPKGQRPEDLVEYAKWILKTYYDKKSNFSTNHS